MTMKTWIDLNIKVGGEIKSIYNKTLNFVLVHNIKNLSMQKYGNNKKEVTKHDLIMRSNLVYVDLS